MNIKTLIRILSGLCNDNLSKTSHDWSVQLGDDCITVFDTQKRLVCVAYLHTNPTVGYASKHPHVSKIKHILEAHLRDYGVALVPYEELRKVKDQQLTMM